MYRILIVDDDELAREAIASLLLRAGYTTFELPSAIGTAATVRREKLDAVILDVNMPAISGHKVAKMLRQNHLFDHVATLLVSGRSQEELSELALASQADAAVTKSNLARELVPTLRRVIASCRNAPTSTSRGAPSSHTRPRPSHSPTHRPSHSPAHRPSHGPTDPSASLPRQSGVPLEDSLAAGGAASSFSRKPR